MGLSQCDASSFSKYVFFAVLFSGRGSGGFMSFEVGLLACLFHCFGLD